MCLLLASKAYAQQVAPHQVASFVFQGVSFIISNVIPKEIVMKGVGYGNTNEEAIQNALNDAVQKSVGIIIVTDQTIDNDKVVRNLAAAYSSGMVSSYEIESCDNKKCTIIAKVLPWNFRRKLEGDSDVVRVNGNDLYAQHSTMRAAMIQRHRLIEYYFQSIRPVGLEVKVRELKITPSMKHMVSMSIDYDIQFNKEFKRDIISFLEKLERDTNGKNKVDESVYIQWGPTGLVENRVYIYVHDTNTRSMMVRYLTEPIEIYFKELNVCQKVDVKNSVFTVDWRDYRNRINFEIDPQKLKDIRKVTAKVGCPI